jgi:hypothetical protein
MSDQLSTRERELLEGWSTMSPPTDFAERVFEARAASTRRLWFAAAALVTAAAAIATFVAIREPAPTVRRDEATREPSHAPAIAPPAPAIDPPAPAIAPPAPTITPPTTALPPAPAVHPGHRGRIAILGIEPVGVAKLQVVAADLQIAKDLTEALRARAKAGAGPYELGPGTDKELIDEKILENCDSEAPACMATIGNELGVDAMIFGKLEHVGTGYRVTLKLLDVGKRTMSTMLTREISADDVSGSALARYARGMYIDLTLRLAP